MKILFRKKVITGSIALLLSALAVAPSQALTLSFLGSFNTDEGEGAGGGAGIAYIPNSTYTSMGTLYVSNGVVRDTNDIIINSTISAFNFEFIGSSINTSFNSTFSAGDTRQSGLHGFESSSRFPSSNTLLMAKGETPATTDRLLEVTTSGGNPGSGRIDLMIDPGINPDTMSSGNGIEAKGVTIGPNGNFLVADERFNRILELDTNGSIINQRDFDSNPLTGSNFLHDLEGIAYYVNSRLFIVSDDHNDSGSATVYELDISSGIEAASFVSETFLNTAEMGMLGDPEGLAIDLANNLLFVSSNTGINGNKVGVYQINAVPIPGALVLLGSALLGLLGVTRRKQAIAA